MSTSHDDRHRDDPSPDRSFEETMATCRRVQKELDVLIGSEPLCGLEFLLEGDERDYQATNEDTTDGIGYLGVRDRLEETIDQDFGDYQILRKIDAGGMGVVYEAWQHSTERRVALKVIAAHLLGDPRTLTRFEQEVKAAARVDHPSLCTVYDAGTWEGRPYIAMRYIHGKTMAHMIAASEDPGKPAGESTGSGYRPPQTRRELSKALQLFRATAEALHAAHRENLVHRDIKPSNIMIDTNDQPVILDFGLARCEERDFQAQPARACSGGTFPYMSPEQIGAAGMCTSLPPYLREEERGLVDRRSDIYSLGVTLYEYLTRRHPFPARTREGLTRKILFSRPPDPRKLNRCIPKDLVHVLEKALEKDPQRRYQTAQEFADDLERVRTRKPVTARPASPTKRLHLWIQRNRLAASFMAALSMSLVMSLLLLGIVLATQVSLNQTIVALKQSVTKRIGQKWKDRDSEKLFTSAERALVAGRAVIPLQPDRRVLAFGVYATDDPETIYNKFDSILAVLENKTAHRIDMHLFSRYETARESLLAGDLDFVRFGPASSIKAWKADTGIVPLVMEERRNEDGIPGITFAGIVFVRADNRAIEKPEDIMGKKVAFGDPDSTICTYLFQDFLVRNGITHDDLEFDRNRDYLGSHEQVAEAVLRGDYDIGCIKFSTYNSYMKGGNSFREIARVENITKPWIARNGLKAEIITRLRNCLGGITKTAHAGALKELSSKCTGFRETSKEHYQRIATLLEDPRQYPRPAPAAQN